MRTALGKIQSVYVGFGGYQDAQFGITLTLGSDIGMWGTGDFRGFWGPAISARSAKWTGRDRDKAYANTMKFIADILTKAKKTHVVELVGVPVEVTFDGLTLKSWRVLEEVI